MNWERNKNPLSGIDPHCFVSTHTSTQNCATQSAKWLWHTTKGRAKQGAGTCKSLPEEGAKVLPEEQRADCVDRNGEVYINVTHIRSTELSKSCAGRKLSSPIS
eukprot:667823-Amphidinium_carterae.1